MARVIRGRNSLEREQRRGEVPRMEFVRNTRIALELGQQITIAHKFHYSPRNRLGRHFADNQPINAVFHDLPAVGRRDDRKTVGKCFELCEPEAIR